MWSSKYEWKLLSHVQSLRPHGLGSPWNSPSQNSGAGSLSLLWGIFPTQGTNPGIPHCSQILYQLSHKGSPTASRKDLLTGALNLQFSSIHSLSRVWLFATPWTGARQTSLFITNSQGIPKIMPIESVMPSNYLILCSSLLHLPSNFPSIGVFSNESPLHIRWPKYWSFSFNISPSNEHSGLISFRMDWLDLLAVQGNSRVFSNTTVQKHQFLNAQLF